MMIKRSAKFALGQRVHHRDHPLRGLIIDVDAVCVGPYGAGVDRDQPFYHLAAIGPEGGVFAYVPESSLEADALSVELTPEEVGLWVSNDGHGRHAPRLQSLH